MAPRVIRPSDKLKIVCTIINKKWTDLNVRALIYTKEQEIATGIQQFKPNVPDTIGLKIPSNIAQDEYRLKIEGRLLTGELKFFNETSIEFEQKAVSILIQLERPDYRHESILRFRCIPIYPDLSPYLGTLDAFIISPHDIVLKRWENVQTNAGVVSLGYIINDAPPPGRYTLKCVVLGYEATKEFDVYEFYQWKHEVNVSMPNYFLTTSSGIHGVVVAK